MDTHPVKDGPHPPEYIVEHFQAMIMYVHTFVALLPCHLSDERECHQIDLLFQIQPEAVVIYAKNRQSTWFFHFD